ncbi:unnamed protein product, partial [Adineta ricciae]
YLQDENIDTGYELILLSNRDEDFQRPALHAHVWKDTKYAVGGQDQTPLREGGTWLCLNTVQKKIGVLLNLTSRLFPEKKTNAQSRGFLVANFVNNPEMHLDSYMDELHKTKMNYTGFNFLGLERQTNAKKWRAKYINNISLDVPPVEIDTCTIFGFSNHIYGDEHAFEKTRHGCNLLKKHLAELTDNYTKPITDESDLIRRLFSLLNDSTVFVEDSNLADVYSHYTIANRNQISSINVLTTAEERNYGTRTSTIILVHRDQTGLFIEKTLSNPLIVSSEWIEHKWHFDLNNVSYLILRESDLMSSTNDAYHHLFVQTLPKSILKKSPSPRFSDASINLENGYTSNRTPSSPSETEKTDTGKYIFENRQLNEKNLMLLSSTDKTSITSDDNFCSYELDHRLIRKIPCADSSSSSLTSDDELQKPTKIKPKKIYSRPVRSSSLSSSENTDERKAKRSVTGSKMTDIHFDKQRHNDMQLDEFMRKYQQHGGIDVSTKADHVKAQTSKENLTNNDGNNYRQSSITHQRTSHITNEAISNETTNFLKSIDTIHVSTKPFSPLQILFDIARTDSCDRRTKIDRLRHYVEEQIGISAFLTVYKLIKSSQIPIDIRQKPFCYYASFISHICCLIMLESEQQRNRF